ncbi:MAG TPA: hypothetical protein ENI73_10795 [Spirochaetes bacterium]|nr:hypothetical protein [Spirochaetota bacterium]
MFDGDIVEPTDRLYQEGNLISRYSSRRKKSHPRNKRKNASPDRKEKKIHKYQMDDLGSLVDVEV